MGGRALLGVLLAAVLLVAGTAASDPGTDKARIDRKIGDLRAQIDRTGQQAGVLTSEISAVTARVRSLQAGIDAEQARLAVIEAELAASRERLAALEERIRDQTERLGVLETQYALAVGQLERRVREIYVSDTPDALSFALGASTFSDVLDTVELLNRIGRQDERIAATVDRTTQELVHVRAETGRARTAAALETRAVAQRAREQSAVRDRLVASRDALASARRAKEASLASIQEDRATFVAEVDALQAQSAALAAKIAAAQAAARSTESSSAAVFTPSASGFIWPVSGPVTSGFGPRWGRMHEGIDIAVPTGTPVYASAAGTVIHAGWFGGYGNLVVVDHGNGIATAYAHNSGYAAGVGQQVAQGQVIAYAGNTGNSFGPHVHFEVRVGGGAVDPLGYL